MRERFDLAVFSTEKRPSGNPLAIFTDAESYSVADMQRIAWEVNYSESVFLDLTRRTARIFSPSTELPFAGHPCIGTAWLLQRLTGIAGFSIPLGTISASANESSASIKFPGEVRITADTISNSLLHALDVRRENVLQVFQAEAGPTFKMIELSSLEALQLAQPTLGHAENKRLYLFYRLSSHQYRARMFGITLPEDPATGSAGCALASHLRRQGLSGRLVIYQGEEMGRPSRVELNLSDTLELGGRVELMV